MAIEAFSADWAREWCRVLNSKAGFATTAAAWEGPVALVMTDGSASDSPSRSVYLDLWHGQCRGARVASADDLEQAQFILAGTTRAWRDVLSGNTAPLMAVLGGKIRLTKGSMGALIPHAAAARELMTAALEMDVQFPESW